MIQLMKASKSNPSTKLTGFEDLQGELEVVEITEKGRGLIAKKIFKPGDLILRHKAIEIVFSEVEDNYSSSSLLLKKVKIFRLLKEKLFSRLKQNEEDLRTKLLTLDPGVKSRTNNNTGKDLLINKTRIEGILLTNGFQGGTSDHPSFGLWYFPSFINHDCWKANAIWTIYNDVIVIRAGKEIQFGDEILISYIEPDQPSFVRKELFLKHNFLCSCKLCRMEDKEGTQVVRRRDEILVKFKEVEDTASVSTINQLKGIVQHLRSFRRTEEDSVIMNPFVIQPLMQLGLCHYELALYDEALNAFQDAIHFAEKFVQFNDLLITLGTAVLQCLMNTTTGNKDVPDFQQWKNRLKEWIQIQYGTEDDWMDILEWRGATVQTHLKNS